MLQVSQATREEFLKHKYWEELARNKATQNYFLAYCYTILRKCSVNILPNSIVQ